MWGRSRYERAGAAPWRWHIVDSKPAHPASPPWAEACCTAQPRTGAPRTAAPGSHCWAGAAEAAYVLAEHSSAASWWC